MERKRGKKGTCFSSAWSMERDRRGPQGNFRAPNEKSEWSSRAKRARYGAVTEETRRPPTAPPPTATRRPVFHLVPLQLIHRLPYLSCFIQLHSISKLVHNRWIRDQSNPRHFRMSEWNKCLILNLYDGHLSDAYTETPSTPRATKIDNVDWTKSEKIPWGNAHFLQQFHKILAFSSLAWNNNIHEYWVVGLLNRWY